jgi:hypothetical protein
MKQIILLIVVFCLFNFAYAEEFNKVGTTAAQFLKVEVGARALAMGGCYGALANDASALYWNPAGITQIDHFQATFTHTQWIADISHGFAGLVIPVDENSTIGVSATYLTMDDIEQTTIEQPRGTGIFYGAQDLAFAATYARSVTEFIQVGATVKMINQSIWNEEATGYALDLGILLNSGIKGIKLAMVMTNFGTDLQLDGRDLIRGYDQNTESVGNPDAEAKLSTEAWPLPTNLRISLSTDIIGIGEELFLQNPDSRLTAIIDLTHPNDNPEHYNFGMEYAYNEQFFGRIGYRGNTDEEGLTMGGGIYLPLVDHVKLMLDYAYADFGVFNNVQHFTIGIQF